MNPDELKTVWQTRTSGRRLVFDEEVILRQVVRGQNDLRAMLFWRDTREVGVALIFAGVFLYFYFTEGSWPFLLIAASVAWISGFMLVDRIRHRKRCPHRQDSVKACAESTLAEVNHQIWLLRNVFWWYLLPPLVALEVFFGYAALVVQEAAAFLRPQPVTLVISIGVYLLNRWAVKAELEPRRREAEALLRSLDAEN
jgi:hypothetical protein